MRYDVQLQIDDIDKAVAILGLREIPNMKQPTEEEFEYALNCINDDDIISIN